MIDNVSNNTSKNLTNNNMGFSFNQQSIYTSKSDSDVNNLAVNNNKTTAAGKLEQQNPDDLTSGDDAQQDKKKKLSDDDVKKLTNRLNKEMDDMDLQLKFIWYKDLDQLGVKMIDSSTQKTIKSFPPEEVMKTLIKTKKWLGKLLDKNV